MVDIFQKGREAFDRKDWAEAYAQLSAADGEASLAPEDLDRLAMAAYLIGRDAECEDYLTRAHQDFCEQGNLDRAARCAFWLGMILLNKREHARASGWLARARRLLDEGRRDCVEQGFLLVPVALRSLGEGEAEKAYRTFGRAAEIGERFENSDLTTLGRLGRGQSLIQLGRMREGVALLDEVMVAVEAGQVSAIVAGIVYCAVLEVCQAIYDLRRAQEWTESMTRWCEAQPALVPYRGQCLVRRSEVMQLHGAWPRALDEARQACERLTAPPGEPAAGAAFYQHGELLRLRGDFSRAEEAYRQASRWGRKPQPGLALLRLAEGEIEAAEAAIRRVMDEQQDRIRRSKVLPAFVEIMLAVDDVQVARAGAEELMDIAAGLDTPFLRAVAARADGAVLLAEGEARAAIERLRQAWTAWEELEAPYEVARTRVLVGLACRALGDEDTAAMELDAARWSFQQLGAGPDVDRVDALLRRGLPGDTHGLTPRQLEVLRLVAAGESNRDIAGALFISERTVERHVSDILARLGVPSRAAATAFAYEHELV